ncbi:MAG: M36 family metallopeptidase [Gracilimonas sp.]|nr:M36 family metallopeptidase [Gracilimonas sp.]
MANGHYYPGVSISATPSISNTKANDIVRNDLGLSEQDTFDSKTKLLIYPFTDSTVTLAYEVVLNAFNPWKYIVDAKDGKIIKKAHRFNQYNFANTDSSNSPMNMMTNSKNKNNTSGVPIATGEGTVYKEHPLRTLNTTIEDLPGLDGSGYLNGEYVDIENTEDPDAYSSSLEFHYDDAYTVTNFDGVSMYYHIDTFRRDYIEGLDVDNNLFEKIDGRVLGGVAENGAGSEARFDWPGFYIEMSFPFTREDKVVYHEYTHAVTSYIVGEGLSYFDDEQGAISEGLSDYFSGSFTGRSLIGEYSETEIEGVSFSRDMKNPDKTHYTEVADGSGDLIVGKHAGGEFFSSILWDIRDEIGSSDTDEIVFDALFRMSSSSDFLEFRDAMIAADQSLLFGNYMDEIGYAFADKGVGSLPDSPSITIDISGTHPQIDWNAVSGADSYNIYRDAETGASSCGDLDDFYSSWSISNTNWTDYSVFIDPQEDILVCYYVTVVDNDLESYPSNRVGTNGMAPLKRLEKPEVDLPEQFALQNNYPNPFNPTTEIRFNLPEDSEVSIRVYNIMGQVVSELVHTYKKAGFHKISFDAENLASGVYIAKMNATGTSGEVFTKEIKMQLIK